MKNNLNVQKKKIIIQKLRLQRAKQKKRRVFIMSTSLILLSFIVLFNKCQMTNVAEALVSPVLGVKIEPKQISTISTPSKKKLTVKLPMIKKTIIKKDKLKDNRLQWENKDVDNSWQQIIFNKTQDLSIEIEECLVRFNIPPTIRWTAYFNPNSATFSDNKFYSMNMDQTLNITEENCLTNLIYNKLNNTITKNIHITSTRKFEIIIQAKKFVIKS